MNNDLKPATILFLMFFCGSTPGATNGQLGRTSEDIIRISLQISPSIRIDTVKNINLRIADRSVDTNFTEELCITGNFGGKYKVTAYGSNNGVDSFTLAGAEGGELIYYVGYRANLQSPEYDNLLPAIASPTYSLSSEESCSGQQSFKITFRTEDLNRVNSGLYTGHLTLLVSPI
jgi:hypothetical protein